MTGNMPGEGYREGEYARMIERFRQGPERGIGPAKVLISTRCR